MNKKRLKKCLAAMCICLLSNTVSAGVIPKIYLNENRLWIQQSPFVKNGVTFVPLRVISESLGAAVSYNNNQIKINLKGKNITCTVGSKSAVVDGTTKTLLEAPIVKANTTYVPLRFISECLGVPLVYDSKTNAVSLSYDVPEDSSNKYINGRSVRTTNLPSNASSFPYILKGIPNEMYQLKPAYAYNSQLLAEDYLIPAKMSTDSLYNEDNLATWVTTIEHHLDAILNVDYRTINEDWAKNVVVDYLAAQKPTDVRYDLNMDMAKKYINFVKKNKVSIKGDFYVEPSICYLYYNAIYIRCWVKYEVSGSTATFYQDEVPIKQGVYEGYVDISVATSTLNSRGDDYVIDYDKITSTRGIHKIS